jgi:predicted membrane protein
MRHKLIAIVTIVSLLFMSFVTNINVHLGEEYIEYNEVALYILEYNSVPTNYVLKSNSSSLETNELTLYDTFRNDEGLLPPDTYQEVYINAVIGNVGEERIVFSDNGVYYTNDHYQSFEEIHKSDFLWFHYVINIFLAIVLIIIVFFVLVSIYILKKLTFQDYMNMIANDVLCIRNSIKDTFEKAKEFVFDISQ